MKKTDAISEGQAREDLFAYFELLDELPLADLLEEARLVSGFSKEKMLVTALAKRLEVLTSAYSLEAA
ncbi:hypothetical protein [Halodesulfovibrio aestuarii]|uniref:hypothetical protein n=1 Tax=Halodesulfovibrio aestuarii TaxID=126333 RepID=UPI003D35998A